MADPIGYVILEWTEGVKVPAVYQPSLCAGPASARAVAEELQEAADIFRTDLRYTAAAVVPIELWKRLRARVAELEADPLAGLS